MVQNLKKKLKLENFQFFSHSQGIKCHPKANNNREAVVVCERDVVKRPSKRSVLVLFNLGTQGETQSSRFSLKSQQSFIINSLWSYIMVYSIFVFLSLQNRSSFKYKIVCKCVFNIFNITNIDFIFWTVISVFSKHY